MSFKAFSKSSVALITCGVGWGGHKEAGQPVLRDQLMGGFTLPPSETGRLQRYLALQPHKGSSVLPRILQPPRSLKRLRVVLELRQLSPKLLLSETFVK